MAVSERLLYLLKREEHARIELRFAIAEWQRRHDAGSAGRLRRAGCAARDLGVMSERELARLIAGLYATFAAEDRV